MIEKYINNDWQFLKSPPALGESIFRDGYAWSQEKKCWYVDISQSQTKRFEKMLAENPNDTFTKTFLKRERQLDGFEQRLREREEAEKRK